MGKKSKKGVSRAGAKKHNAAGHGKSTTTTTTKARSRSDSKASFESGGSNNAFNVNGNAGVASTTPNFIDVLNKENNAATQAMQTIMTDVEKILISPPGLQLQEPNNATVLPTVDTPVISPPIEVIVSNEEPVVTTEFVETKPMLDASALPESNLEKVVAMEETVTNVGATKPSSVESVAEIAQSSKNVNLSVPPNSTEIDDQPLFCVSDSPIDTDAAVNEKEAPTLEVSTGERAKSKASEPVNVWSSKLRDAVSLVDADEMVNQPVLDVPPIKQPSKLVVPAIQTVSPSPDGSKQVRPPPTLDTPDAKDMENTKQNECGCIIV